MRGLRLGVAGLGRIGLMHARNAAQADGVDQVVLLGRDSEKTRHAAQLVSRSAASGAPPSLAGEHAPEGHAPADITCTERFADVLPELDCVIIATPTETHPEMAIRAAEAGVPTLVEKPLALDLSVLDATCRRLENSGTPVMVAFHRRYDPAHHALRERIRNGDAGAIRVVVATDHDRLPLDVGYIPRSGGIWRDLLVHDFDIIPWVAGQRVVSVRARGSVLDAQAHADHGDVDTAVALLELESGAFATVSGTRRNDAGQDVRLEVFGSGGTFATGFTQQTPVVSTERDGYAPHDPYQQFIDRFELAFRHEIDAFLRVTRGEHKANESEPRAGIAALQVALAAQRSMETGTAIAIADMMVQEDR